MRVQTVKPQRKQPKGPWIPKTIEETGTLTVAQQAGVLDFYSLNGLRVQVANLPTPIPLADNIIIELPYGSTYTPGPNNTLILTWGHPPVSVGKQR